MTQIGLGCRTTEPQLELLLLCWSLQRNQMLEVRKGFSDCSQRAALDQAHQALLCSSWHHASMSSCNHAFIHPSIHPSIQALVCSFTHSSIHSVILLPNTCLPLDSVHAALSNLVYVVLCWQPAHQQQCVMTWSKSGYTSLYLPQHHHCMSSNTAVL